jgi:hypothetical protein
MSLREGVELSARRGGHIEDVGHRGKSLWMVGEWSAGAFGESRPLMNDYGLPSAS